MPARCRPPRMALRLAVSTTIFLTGLATPSAFAQFPQVTATYSGVTPSERFHYKWQGNPGSGNAGRFDWSVPASELSTSGLDRQFTGYCGEVLVPIVGGRVYQFEVRNPSDPAVYGLPNTPAGR